MFFKRKKQILMKIRKARFITAGLFLLWVWEMPVFAAENELCHEHTNGCYEERWIDCTDTVKVTHYNQDFYCPDCKRISTAVVMVETYVCSDGYMSREFRSTGYCYNSETVVYTKEVPATTVHRRPKQICVCGMNENSVIARAELVKSTEEWTKDGVTLTVNITEPTEGVTQGPYSITFSESGARGETFVAEKNGTYTATVTASDGRKMSTSVLVSNIDKNAPDILDVSVNKSYPEYDSATITITAQDSESTLADTAYSFDGGKTFVAQNSLTITSNGTYTVVVRDRAGNCATQTLSVSCFAAKKDEEIKTTQGENQIQSTTSSKKSVQKSSASKQQNTVKSGENHSKTFSEEKKDIDKTTIKLHLTAQQTPGVTSSRMRIIAEENAVPTTLNILSDTGKKEETLQSEETQNLVENMVITKENEAKGVTFAQATKVTVAAGVLMCIGMMTVSLLFLVKKHP